MRKTAAALLALATTAAAQPPETQPPDVRAADVDALFERWSRPGSPGAAVAVVRGGEIAFERGYGEADLEHGIANTPETVFDVASVSKQFCAFAIALLVDRGALSIDDDVRKHVPRVSEIGTEITLRHLVHHTGGVRDWPGTLALAGWRMDDVITFEQILTMASRQRSLNFAPGEQYLYSNTGYNLLARTVENVTGQSFREWMAENVFEPLGMEHTHFHDDHTEVVPSCARSYRRRGDGYAVATDNLTALGSSSLFTTVRALAKWADNFRRPVVGSAAVHEMMHQQGRLNNGWENAYAFGQSFGFFHRHESWSHSGSWAGFRSYLLRLPDDDLAVIVLGNASDLPAQQLAERIAALCLGLEPGARTDGSDVWAPVSHEPPDDVNLERLLGRYWSEELGTAYDVVPWGDTIALRHWRHPEIALRAVGPLEFGGSTWFAQDVRFTTTSEGAVSGLVVSSPRVKNVRFARQPR